MAMISPLLIEEEGSAVGEGMPESHQLCKLIEGEFEEQAQGGFVVVVFYF